MFVFNVKFFLFYLITNIMTSATSSFILGISFFNKIVSFLVNSFYLSKRVG